MKKDNLKIDFSKVSVQLTFEGEARIVDFRKDLGNAIRAATGDIAVDEFARKVYFTEGEIEVPKEYVPIILKIITERYNVAAQEAFRQLLRTDN